jgi:hypothetical protein
MEYIRLNYSSADRSHMSRLVEALPEAIAEARSGIYRDQVIRFFSEQKNSRGAHIVESLKALG